MNTPSTQPTEEDIRLGNTPIRLDQQLQQPKSGSRLLAPTRPEQPNPLAPKGLKRLENLPLSCYLNLLTRDTGVFSMVGPDRTGILNWAAGYLWKQYQLNIEESFGGQLGYAQGTNLLVSGERDKLKNLDEYLRQQNNQFTLTGYKFKPAMHYRFCFSAPDKPGLTYLTTQSLNRLALNIEAFSTRDRKTRGGVYALLDMRLEIPATVTPRMMQQLEADLLTIEPTAQVDLYPEP